MRYMYVAYVSVLFKVDPPRRLHLVHSLLYV
jgi:hypothetical protein